jgi:CoA:oxalate CoA-transferase
VAGIGFALFHRERTGEGQHIDIAMVDTLFHAHELSIQGPSITNGKWMAKRMGAKSTMNTPQGVFPVSDGYIVIQCMQAQWAGFCRAIGQPELEHDERFAGLGGRHKNKDELNALIDEWTMSHTTESALAALESERVPCAPVLSRHGPPRRRSGDGRVPHPGQPDPHVGASRGARSDGSRAR